MDRVNGMHNIAVFMGKMGVFAPSAQIILSCQFPEYTPANCAIDRCASNAEAAFLCFVRNDLRRPETLKAADPMAWVQRMNSIRNRAEEIIREELIYNG